MSPGIGDHREEPVHKGGGGNCVSGDNGKMSGDAGAAETLVTRVPQGE